ncbi:inorganic diphosphatase [Granulosicoccus sp.]|nr:inorganic diphosphatase [Granulosicoccus sp.]
MKHPKFETVYECNYGYVADTVAGDGKEIDVYVLGLEEPAEKYKCKCIAIIFRSNDVEHKLVVSDAPLPIDEIHSRTNFIERYFEIRMEVLDV